MGDPSSGVLHTQYALEAFLGPEALALAWALLITVCSESISGARSVLVCGEAGDYLRCRGHRERWHESLTLPCEIYMGPWRTFQAPPGFAEPDSRLIGPEWKVR